MLQGNLTVTELARASGVGRETIRFYEQRGLLPAPPRSRSGYRLYALDAPRRVRFIKTAQALGFTLEEISDLLQLRTTRGCTRRVVKARAMRKVADIDRKIAGLAAMKAALLDITACCDGGSAPAGDCPILSALEAGKKPG
jgi:MerR family mercuric resistance operon transcriptional regulator